MTSGYNVPLYPGYPNTYDLGGILSSLGKAIKAIPDDALSDIGSPECGAEWNSLKYFPAASLGDIPSYLSKSSVGDNLISISPI